MRLVVTTPFDVVIDREDVAYVRAEDATGAFGILPRHADMLTALTVSVVTWRDHSGREHHVAVREGMLEVRGGESVAIATREAVPGDDLEQLVDQAIARFYSAAEEERASRKASEQLYLNAIRRIYEISRSI